MFLSEWCEFPSASWLAGKKKKLDNSSRLDVVEIARVPYMLPSLFPSWSGIRTYQHPGRQRSLRRADHSFREILLGGCVSNCV